MSSIGRKRFLPVLALLLVFLALSECYREKRKERKRGNNDVCVHVKMDFRRVDVATCDFGTRLASSVHEVKADVQHLEKKLVEVSEDVGILQGNNNSLYRIFVTLGSDTRRFCEIYTVSEAVAICQSVFGINNPDVHYAHIPCGPGQLEEECPKTFWRGIPGCFRPNANPLSNFRCLISPTILENCTQPVFLSCEGFTPNISLIKYTLNIDDVLDEFPYSRQW